MTTTFWPNAEHWSCEIPLDTPHPRLDVLRERGFVQLRDLPFVVPEHEYLDLEYMDWKSGGDTNFAPIATADGELDCRGFWNKGDERPDKGARFTANAAQVPDARARGRERSAPTSDACARSSSSRRITTPRSAASTATTTTASTPRPTVGSCARGSSSPTSPRATCCLMDTGPDGLPDPATEVRLALHRGARFLLDTQRLWHVVVHNGNAPRYALISSFESGPALDAWVQSQLP